MAQLNDFSKIIHIGNEIGKVLHQGKTIWKKGVYLAQDSDFVKVNEYWVYRGTELEVEIPTHINGGLVTSTSRMFRGDTTYQATPVTKVVLKHSNVTDMSVMFYGSSATTLDLSNFDTSNVTSMYYMFYESSATTLDLSNFDTSNVTNMSNMFYGSSATTGYARTQADADKFNASSNKPAGLNFVVKPDVYLAQDSDFVKVDGNWVYRGAELEIEMPTHINGQLVTSAYRMFSGDSTYQATPVTKVVLKHSSVTNMYYMFSDSSATTLDLSSFNTSNVTDMGFMFYNSSTTILDLSSFDTSNVTNMYYMFSDSSATTLDLSSFNTSNVNNMSFMFRNSSATTLDLSSFNTSSVTDMGYMFYESSATKGYARTKADANKFNASSNKPAGLNFVVKP